MYETFKNKIMGICEWSLEDYSLFSEVCADYILDIRGEEAKYHLYTQDYLENVLALTILLDEEDKLYSPKVFLIASLLNGMFNELDNFQIISEKYHKQYKNMMKDLESLFTSKEVFYILNFLFHNPLKDGLLYFEDYDKDYHLFDDVRKYSMIVKLDDKRFVRLSDDPEECGSNIKEDPFPVDDFFEAVFSIKKIIIDKDIKDLYQIKINTFYNTLSLKEY